MVTRVSQVYSYVSSYPVGPTAAYRGPSNLSKSHSICYPDCTLSRTHHCCHHHAGRLVGVDGKLQERQLHLLPFRKVVRVLQKEGTAILPELVIHMLGHSGLDSLQDPMESR